MKVLLRICSLLLCTMIALQGIAQDPGGNPDGPPPAVPMDDYMHLIMAAIGIVFAVYTFRRMQWARLEKEGSRN